MTPEIALDSTAAAPRHDSAEARADRAARRRSRSDDDPPSFGGLGNMILPPDDIADHAGLIAEIDRLGATLQRDTLRQAIIALLAETMDASRSRVRTALIATPDAGLRVARAYAHATDVVVAGAVHYVMAHVHPAPIRTRGERLSIIAVGGYGRGEMAPFSDVDLLFLTPQRRTAWAESVVETLLYLLWDLKLKVGQSTRSIAECMRYAGEDWTIRTNLLEMRLIAGDRDPFEALSTRLWEEMFLKTGPQFVAAKLEERDRRHERHGGSRYLLEPNVKEGKGGLRDLQTLHWISRYLYRVEKAWELCPLGVFEEEEVQRFADAAKFLWAVRSHLHDIAGRATEALTFDRQVDIARRLGYQDHDGRMGVEHFMHRYFRHAKDVGDLTRIFSAVLEAQHAKPRPRLSSLMRAMTMIPGDRKVGPFKIRDDRLTVSDERLFEEEPIAILSLFREAARADARIHPQAMRLVTLNLDRIDDRLRSDPQAAEIFFEILTDAKNGEWLLGLMNETGVLGRFIPEFGAVVAMMQFNMYHHYTVDEHTLETLRTLARIERGEARDDHPVATEISRQGVNRRVLYVALLAHDLGKGRPEDHSVLGAEIAAGMCRRLGLPDVEAELVVWLVRHHLLMSDVAQKRDISDPITVRDFAQLVQSPERLRLLLILTVCDIRGVGPGVWNNWKAQLLRKLYWDTRAQLTGGGDTRTTQAARVREAKTALEEAAKTCDPAIPPEILARELDRHFPQYWLGLDTEAHALFLEMAAGAGMVSDPETMHSRFHPDPSRDVTVAALHMHDHPGLFSRMAGAFALSGANVVDARSYTTGDGMTYAIFWIQDADGRPFEESRLHRLRRSIERTLRGEVVAREALAEKTRDRPRERPFTVPTQVIFDNDASELYTVIEVNARDRIGLLNALTRTLSQQNVNIFTAIIATYGERAVDVFYVKDLFGLKVHAASKQARLAKALTEAVEAIETATPDAGGDLDKAPATRRKPRRKG
ncbi:MAG: [protein-PII] uridylyltransferase [Pseudomonadota bacterium]